MAPEVAASCATLPSMKRRTLLTLGAAGSVLLAAGGYVAATMQPGWARGRLTSAGRAVFIAITPAVLDRLAPPTPAAMAAHLQHLEEAVAGLPPALQAEVAELTTVLATAPGRRWLAGLAEPWEQASPAQVTAAHFGQPELSAGIGYTGQPTV
jgi:hypothetical protein